MMMCKVPQSEMKLLLSTLDKIQIAPGLDNADMYVGVGLRLRQVIEEAEEVEDG